MISKINVFIVNFNTIDLTNICVRSIIKNCGLKDYSINVFDNSNKQPFATSYNVNIIDNTKGQLIDLEGLVLKNLNGIPYKEGDYGSYKHCITIQYILDHYDNVLLFDSDIVLKKKIDFIDEDVISAFGIEQRRIDSWGFLVEKRSVPFIHYFNTKKLRELNIRYFDNDRICCGSVPRKTETVYDTGASFLEDIQNYLGYKIINHSEYINHLGHGSWKQHILLDKWKYLNRNFL